MRHLPLIFSLFLCAPAMAQAPVDAVLEAMTRAGGTAARMASYLNENGVAVEYGESPSGARSRRTWKRITLNPACADSVPYGASVIAFEAAELMYAGMPESAEKRYTAVAIAAHTYFELGGDAAALSDAEWAKSLAFWKENEPRKGVKALRKQGKPSLADLRERTESGLDNLRRSNGQAVILGALSGTRGRLGYGLQSGYLGQMIDGAKGRLKTLRAAEKDFKEFRKVDKARRQALAL